MQFKKFEIKETGKYGLGVFANSKINTGEIITILKGERASEAYCEKKVEEGLLNNDDPLQIEKDYYLILDHTSHAFNHSCTPNAGLRGESTLFALSDILPGEEITYDYSTTVGPENFTFTTMNNCLCGSIKCRKILGNVLSIPKDNLNFYFKKGAIQNYILNELNDI